LGALPARFRRERLLIVGCGDVGLRVVKLAKPNVRVMAITSQETRIPQLRSLGVTPLRGNLDQPHTLRRLGGLATRIVHLAPPPLSGGTDPRTASLVQAMRLRAPAVSVVYGSTTGVYGDCQGAWVTETRATHALTDRAQRRLNAEQWIRLWGASGVLRTSILRVPGIYALDREGGTPRERLMRQTPVLCPEDDVYTNHIHADDLALAFWLSVWRNKPQRVLNVNDDTQMTMGAYVEWAADLWGLPKPKRITREEAKVQLSTMLMSFMSESRRMDNTRMKIELKLKLRYPTIKEGLSG